MMSFLRPSLCQKQFLWAFPRSPNILFYPCSLTTFGSHKIYNIFNFNICNVPYVFLASFDILFNAFNPQHFGAPYCSKKHKTIVDLAPWCFKCPFSTPLLLFVVILSFLIKAIIFLLFPIPYHLWCCSHVFLLFTKFRSFLNQNIEPIQILTKDIRIWQHLLGLHPILGCSS